MYRIRTIRAEDNALIAGIIRSVMQEFNADPQTTVLGDPTVDRMFETYREASAVYYVVEQEDEVVGGCGIRQLDGTAEKVCELQRMFLTSAARGKGIGEALLKKCLEDAAAFGYEKVYLESLPDMKVALGLYEKNGFTKIPKAMGCTGHGGCDIYMVKSL